MLQIAIAIGVITVAVFATYKIRREPNALLVVAIGVAFGLISYIVSGGILCKTIDPPRYEESYPIASLSDRTITEASFFLGSGHINERPYYFFYQQDTEGGFHIEYVPADKTIIYEDSLQPRISKFNPTWRAYLISLDYSTLFKIYVPQGTIIRDFTLDM